MAINLPDIKNSTDPAFLRKKTYFDNLVKDFFNDLYFPINQTLLSNELSPRIDISETESEYNLEAELPGISLKDIEVKVDNNILTIKGNKSENSEKKERNYYIRERYNGLFQRSISLPDNIIKDQIKADFENGILHILIPKALKSASHKIEVKSK